MIYKISSFLKELSGGLVGLLMISFMLFNFLGGIVAFIWLAILGEWKFIFQGFLSFICSSFLLGLALSLSFILIVPIAMLMEKISSPFIKVLLSIPSILYTYLVFLFWCAFVLFFTYKHGVITDSLVPSLLWGYSIALGPISYMAHKEQDNPYSQMTNLFVAVGYALSLIGILFFDNNFNDSMQVIFFVLLTSFGIQLVLSYIELKNTFRYF